MKIKIEFNMENAAFGNNTNAVVESPEVVRILKDLTGRIERRGTLDWQSSGVLVDANGNKVGNWSVER
jgi:hypothetical protein